MELSKMKKPAFIVSLALLAIIGSSAAFLTSHDYADNTFYVAKVDLTIEENFDENKTLSAGEMIQKQPWVKNTGNVDQLFFVEVYVPCMETTLLDSAGQRITPSGFGGTPQTADDYRQTTEIFNLLADGTPTKAYITKPTVNNDVTQNLEFSYNKGSTTASGWYYMRQTQNQVIFHNKQGFQDGTYNAYLFGYNTAVVAGKNTIPIFDNLQLRSMIDAEIDSELISQVTITAYTIQANELNITGLTGDGTVTTPYTESDLEHIYQVYENKAITAQGGVSP
ncbi:MAG: hypothetical protein K6B38_03475 [Ruminococcus sp.]|nr:hypothetical protein [Ruminococcus sp.]